MFFPFGDRNTAERFPVVTFSLVAANLIVYAAFLLFVFFEHEGAFLYINWAFVPAQFGSTGQFVTLFTSMFMHAGPLHLLGNLLFLWTFGQKVEDALGHWPFLAFYLLAGVASALAHGLVNLGSPVPFLGASGAVSGVLGAYYIAFPHQRISVLVLFVIPMKLPALTLLFAWVLFQVVLGFGAMLGDEEGGVAYWAHVGGFVFGALAFKALAARGLARPYSERERVEEEDRARAADEAVDIRALRKARERQR